MEAAVTHLSLSRSSLVSLKVRALRCKVWYRVLNPIERSVIDLTIKVVDKVQSSFLARILRDIVNKVVEALEGRVNSLMRTIGRQLALKISSIARLWGCKTADTWALDFSFIRFLTIMHINDPKIFRV